MPLIPDAHFLFFALSLPNIAKLQCFVYILKTVVSFSSVISVFVDLHYFSPIELASSDMCSLKKGIIIQMS